MKNENFDLIIDCTGDENFELTDNQIDNLSEYDVEMALQESELFLTAEESL